MFNVLHPETGKPMNDRLLTREGADRIVENFKPEEREEEKEEK